MPPEVGLPTDPRRTTYRQAAGSPELLSVDKASLPVIEGACLSLCTLCLNHASDACIFDLSKESSPLTLHHCSTGLPICVSVWGYGRLK